MSLQTFAILGALSSLATSIALPNALPYTSFNSAQGLYDQIKLPDPPGAAPRRQELKTDHFLPGVKRVKIRSGPYNAPNMGKVSFPTMEHGMLWNYPDRKVEKPCVECTILKQWAGLEFPNGTDANIDSGLWLHHMVHFTAGPSRWDPVCYNSLSLPHVAVKLAPSSAERYFSSGNERTAFDFNRGGKDMSFGNGYHITADDKFSFLVDLMNTNMEDKLVYMTMTYDIIDGPLPKGWNSTKTVWLDAFSCGTSEVWPPQEHGKFEISSKKWTPNLEGRVIDSIGHLHDGGSEVETKVTDTNSLCTSQTRYSETPNYVFRGPNMEGTHVAEKHISSMTPCQLQVKQMTKNQAWQVIGRYDYDKFEGNTERGKQGEIMAIDLVVVEIPPGGAPKP
jgi:hypothetical protein